MTRKLVERKRGMRRRKKKPFKLKHKITLKINLIVLMLEWQIELGE